ncbi:putative alt1-alanine aminotransferase [Tilletiaria anomala UBC 951]|uniref:Glutamate pyruvate transaminase n=1 Tax=Tilletiaria anomala (strain ATCC 24038 / CBS 436.72 / UBC 951) TaxID=1037660 RepID=A0A066W5B8_TILAU|nr:putative alt1-alanine aminotransferase [Tilletiaria anomala UBC 951]KDN46269.1 putative alt1-alanine aminotransferase [Tilletiaria anomala UBC 951]
MAFSSKVNGHASSSYRPVVTLGSINPHIRNVEYAVRGELSNRANEYAEALASPSSSPTNKLPFNSIVSANIGNPQQQPNLAQQPLTFWRQVAALTELPSLMDDEAVRAARIFPADAIARAREILNDVGSVGAYSHSKGASSIRKHVAQFIQQRDSSAPRAVRDAAAYSADPEHIFLTTGASGGVQLLMQVLIASPSVGIAIPIPQYPLYSATLSLYNAKTVRYELNPSDDWSLDVDALSASIQAARRDGTDVRAVVVINPGNPTGQCLSEANIADLVRFAHAQRLVLFADEVYQANIYTSARPFVSFKKVLRDFSQLESQGGKAKTDEERRIADEVELVSFHSISKGFTGECGRRGGYFELVNFDPDVLGEVYKMASVSLCPSIQGQIGIDLLVKPPAPGEPSYELYQRESQFILETLKERSTKMHKAFNQLEGVSANEAQGALYLFPAVRLPPKAVQAAQKEGKKVDEFYCLAMLDATGICVVPGSGFGKMPHERNDGGVDMFFRTTILAKETDAFIERYERFHKEFLDKYRS